MGIVGVFPAAGSTSELIKRIGGNGPEWNQWGSMEDRRPAESISAGRAVALEEHLLRDHHLKDLLLKDLLLKNLLLADGAVSHDPA